MSKGVVLALRGSQEAQLLDHLGRSKELNIARRLSEITEVIAAVGASVGSVAVVDVASAVDRGAITAIKRNAGTCIVLSPPSQLDHWEKMGAFAVDETLDPVQIVAQIEALSRDGSVRVVQTAASELSQEDPSGKKIVVTGPYRTGRSLIALNLAHELARKGRSVILVDADIWQPALALMLGLSPERHGIATLMRRHEEKTMDITQVEQICQELSPQLMGITGITAPRQWREATEDALRALLQLLNRHFEFVIVDAPTYLQGETTSEWDVGPNRNAAFQTLISNADQLMVVGNPDVVSMSRMVSFLQVLPDLTGLQPVIVMNRMRISAAGMRARQSVAEILLEFGGVKEAHFLPEDPKTADRSLLRGVFLQEVNEDSPLVQAIEALATDLDPELSSLPPARSRWWKRRTAS